MSKKLGVSRSSYYTWQSSRPKGKLWNKNKYLSERIRSIYNEKKQRYGSPRITAELRDEGFSCSKNRIARLMKIQGITARVER